MKKKSTKARADAKKKGRYTSRRLKLEKCVSQHSTIKNIDNQVDSSDKPSPVEGAQFGNSERLNIDEIITSASGNFVVIGEESTARVSPSQTPGSGRKNVKRYLYEKKYKKNTKQNCKLAEKERARDCKRKQTQRKDEEYRIMENSQNRERMQTVRKHVLHRDIERSRNHERYQWHKQDAKSSNNERVHIDGKKRKYTQDNESKGDEIFHASKRMKLNDHNQFNNVEVPKTHHEKRVSNDEKYDRGVPVGSNCIQITDRERKGTISP